MYERLNSVGTSTNTESQLQSAITWAIQQYDSAGSFIEAFKKLGAYTTLPDHFLKNTIPSGASWTNDTMTTLTPQSNSLSTLVVLESFGLKPYKILPISSTVPQNLNIIIDFSGSPSTTNSVRLVRKTATGSIIPFGSDATSSRYSAVINFFGFATPTSNNIIEAYVTPINAGTTGRTATITYQLAG